jgi:hypothetical protein
MLPPTFVDLCGHDESFRQQAVIQQLPSDLITPASQTQMDCTSSLGTIHEEWNDQNLHSP